MLKLLQDIIYVDFNQTHTFLLLSKLINTILDSIYCTIIFSYSPSMATRGQALLGPLTSTVLQSFIGQILQGYPGNTPFRPLLEN